MNKGEVVVKKTNFSIEKIIKLSPFLLVFAGGALGGICGGLAWSFNEYFFKKDISTSLKYVAAFFSLIVAGGLYILLVAILVAIFPNFGR